LIREYIPRMWTLTAHDITLGTLLLIAVAVA
jgi:hypothetical protein